MTSARVPHLRIIAPDAPWTQALDHGVVRIPGFTYETVPTLDRAPQRFAALARGEADVGEAGVKEVLAERLSGLPARAIPVFFGREHMQRNIIVRKDSPLTHPQDLPGRRIGSRQPITAGTNIGVLVMLEQGYGLPLDQITWRVRELDDLRVNRMALKIEQGPATLEESIDELKRGVVDAITVGGGPRYRSLFGHDAVDEVVADHPGLRPLITDTEVIADTYRRTKLYPITDLVVLRSGLAVDYPDLPGLLVAAFAEANRLAPRYRISAEEFLAQQEIELLGEDPHIYGLGPSQRRSLEALIDLLYRLGVIARPVPVDDLFIATSGA